MDLRNFSVGSRPIRPVQWLSRMVLAAFLLAACSGTPGTAGVPPTEPPPAKEGAASTGLPAEAPAASPTAARPVSTATASPEPVLPSATPEPVLDCSAAGPAPAAAWRFVFASQGKLWIKDGEEEARVLAEIDNLQQVDFSNDGEQVVFTRIDPSGYTEIWSLGSDGQELQRLVDGAILKGVTGIDDFSFSPDGSSVVIIYRPEDQTLPGELWIADLDGSRTEKLVDVQDLAAYTSLEDKTGSLILPLTWIPDGSRLLLHPTTLSNYADVPDPLIWVDVETGELGEFLPGAGGGMVSFSPDGKRLTLATKTGIGVFDLGSQELLQKLEVPELKYTGLWIPDPQWAPDSSRFRVGLPPRDAPSTQDYTVPAPVTLWSVGLDGTDPQEITTIYAELSGIGFSPDLGLTAFTSEGTIEILDESGAALKKLTTQAAGYGMDELYFKRWSPDSRRFTYLAGSGSCACGYDIIADVCSDERLKLHENPYFSGYVRGFIAWLDSDDYLYFDYLENTLDTADLVLGNLEGEAASWPVKPDVNLIDYWNP